MKSCWCGNEIKKGNLCQSCYVNVRRFSLKRQCVQYLGGKCIVCNYNKNIQALIFHHINEEDKLFDLSGAHARSWENIQKELDKCQLLCSNCHHELHEQRSKEKRQNKFIEVINSKDQQRIDSLISFVNLT